MARGTLTPRPAAAATIARASGCSLSASAAAARASSSSAVYAPVVVTWFRTGSPLSGCRSCRTARWARLPSDRGERREWPARDRRELEDPPDPGTDAALLPGPAPDLDGADLTARGPGVLNGWNGWNCANDAAIGRGRGGVFDARNEAGIASSANPTSVGQAADYYASCMPAPSIRPVVRRRVGLALPGEPGPGTRRGPGRRPGTGRPP